MIDTTTTAQDRITEAYAAIIARAGLQMGAWVMLTDLRDEVGESINRHVMDDALRALDLRANVNLVPESNQKMLTEMDRDCAVVIGAQDKHAIAIW